MLVRLVRLLGVCRGLAVGRVDRRECPGSLGLDALGYNYQKYLYKITTTMKIKSDWHEPY